MTAEGVDESARLDGFTVSGGFADGGGEHDDDGAGALLVDARPVIARCTFEDNQTAGGGGGAGIEVTGTAAPVVIDCSFTRNLASEGQAMRLASGAAELIVLVNCVFALQPRNALGGSAIFANGPALDVINCTFWFNDTWAGSQSGGQIKIASGSQVTITNTIIWDPAHGPWIVVHEQDSSVTVDYSDVQGGEAGVRCFDDMGMPITCAEPMVTWGPNNIGEDLVVHDPMFVDPISGNYHLGPLCSRCIDRGDDGAVPPDSFDVNNDGDPLEPTPDRDVMDRIVDGLQASFGDPAVDMGAHEFVPPPCPWDCQANPDGAVGINDMLDLLVQWDDQCTSCDFGLGVALVGISEYLELLARWSTVCPGSIAPPPPSLEEELAEACLTMDDWDQHVASMTDPSRTQEEKDNSDCWMRHYINQCSSCICFHPPGICPGPDPFAD